MLLMSCCLGKPAALSNGAVLRRPGVAQLPGVAPLNFVPVAGVQPVALPQRDAGQMDTSNFNGLSFPMALVAVFEQKRS